MTTSWKLHRVFLGATQQEISTHSGISCSKLRQIEQGVRKPTKEEQAALLEAFRYLNRAVKSPGGMAVG